METVLEYLAVAALIVVILLAANQMLSAPAATLETVRQEQLYTVAERVLDKIVLTPGYPPDWGTNIAVSAENLQDFGLALAGSREPYRVDPDKVMRLANLSTLPNPLLLNTSRMAQLLGLEGYGFRLRIVPMLRVLITPIGYYTYGNFEFASTFRIRVENVQGLGVPNAEVTGMYVLVRVQPGTGQAEVEARDVISARASTDTLGECVLDFTPSLQQYFSDPQNRPDKWFFAFLIVRAEWRGFVSVAGYATNAHGDAPVEGYIIGNYVFLNRSIDISVPVVRGNRKSGAVLVKDELLQAVPEYQELLNFTTVIWCRDSSGNFRSDDPLCDRAGRVLPSAKQWYLVGYISHVEPLASHVFIFAQFRGRPIAVVVNRIPSVDISTSIAMPASAVRLTRMCTVYNYPFLVELAIWREVEGYP